MYKLLSNSRCKGIVTIKIKTHNIAISDKQQQHRWNGRNQIQVQCCTGDLVKRYRIVYKWWPSMPGRGPFLSCSSWLHPLLPTTSLSPLCATLCHFREAKQGRGGGRQARSRRFAVRSCNFNFQQVRRLQVRMTALSKQQQQIVQTLLDAGVLGSGVAPDFGKPSFRSKDIGCYR